MIKGVIYTKQEFKNLYSPMMPNLYLMVHLNHFKHLLKSWTSLVIFLDLNLTLKMSSPVNRQHE